MPLEPFVPFNFANIRYRFSCVGVAHEMGFSVGVAALPAETELLAFNAADAFLVTVLDNGAFLGDQWTFLGAIAYIPNFDGDTIVQEAPASIQGTFSQNTIPPNCALLVQKRTGLAGRHNRGRIFCPPFSVLDVDINAAGSMSGAAAGGFTTLFNAWRDEMITREIPIVLFHHHDTDTDGDELMPTTVTSFVAQAQLATQRRRLR